MLQHTLGRTDRLGTPHRKIRVVAQSHQGFAGEVLGRQRTGLVIPEPTMGSILPGVLIFNLGFDQSV
ncbi:hypothetical protein [uncultured Nitrospira sp.]|uniref:hypothetical protein n=1 Tax=uncultured Nitrospira sp. TaxID=157176 RepID=UPI003140450A